MSQVWPVTGAARGLGMAIAQAALEAGHQLVATARDTGNLGLTFRHVPVHRLLGAKLDVSDLDQAHQVARAALDTFGRVDVLVNNAGYGQLSAFEETTPDEVRAQLDTNLFGVMNVTRAVSPLMRAQRAGRIFNVASIGGYGSSNRGGVYWASKFAVVGFTEALAAEVAEFGISATVVAPGYFRTDFLDPSSAGFGGSAPIVDYAASTAAFRQAMADMNHAQEGDPAKLGRVLVELANAGRPPLNFPVGRDAVEYITAHHQHVLEEIAAWRGLTETTGYDPGNSQLPGTREQGWRESDSCPE
jgi:NAD(P)-dependent dehydrogenase (short-subunit alcohol dehydrogenase family)